MDERSSVSCWLLAVGFWQTEQVNENNPQKILANSQQLKANSLLTSPPSHYRATCRRSVTTSPSAETIRTK